MKKRLLSFQTKIFLLLLICTNIIFFSATYVEMSLLEKTLMSKQQEHLMSTARLLDFLLGDDDFDTILHMHGADNASREDKIAVLHTALKDRTNMIANVQTGLAAGYYGKDLDAILTYGPSELFDIHVGKSLHENHHGRVVLATGIANVGQGRMTRGNLINAAWPIVRRGEIIGYASANFLESQIFVQLSDLRQRMTIIFVILFFTPSIILFIFSRRTVKDMGTLIDGIHDIQDMPNYRIPTLTGDMGKVAEHINTMAENTELAKQRSEQAINVLQTIMDNINVGIYVCDPQTQTTVYINSHLQKLIGDSVFKGTACQHLFAQEFPTCAHYRDGLFCNKDGSPNFTPFYQEKTLTLTCDTPNATKNNFLCMDRLITWYDGRLLHMAVFTDITSGKALIEAEATNRAQRAFLARMSHEIRTPLNGVLGMTYLALQEKPLPKQREYLNSIQTSASLLLGIINDILDFSRIEAGKMVIQKQVFNLHQTIKNIQDLILPRALENHNQLSILLNDDLPQYVTGDALRLSQILINLLGNAVKFTVKGTVTLQVHASPLPSNLLQLHCKVTDTGMGMTQEQQKELFKPFSQGSASIARKLEGTGLGLSIAKRLIELMHGEISVQSKHGQGSTFSFFIEIETAACPIENTIEETPLWQTTHYDGHTILVAEDNMINQEIMRAVLVGLGITVDIVENGQEAIDAFLAKDYSMIFMDLHMPLMGGLEATRTIRTNAKHDAHNVPIIAVTAHAMEEHKQETQHAGMNNHLSKPIDIDAMKQLLYTYLHKK